MFNRSTNVSIILIKFGEYQQSIFMLCIPSSPLSLRLTAFEIVLTIIQHGHISLRVLYCIYYTL